MAPSIDIGKTLKCVPRLWAAFAFLAFIAANMLLFMGRKVAALRPGWLLDIAPGFYSHVSNLSIAAMLYAAIGYFWLMMGVTLRHVLWLGAAIAAVNVVYEGFVPILNTRDWVDAGYGVAGVVLAAILLAIIQRRGLIPNPAFAPKP